jgi:hypothetical protein
VHGNGPISESAQVLLNGVPARDPLLFRSEIGGRKQRLVALRPDSLLFWRAPAGALERIFQR